MRAIALAFILTCMGCTRDHCSNPIDFKLSFIWHGDAISLDLDDGKEVYREEFEEPFRYTNESLHSLIDGYCSIGDSIKVKFTINEKDTTFYLLKEGIKGCYLGSDLEDGFFIFYDFKEGGLRDHRPID